MSGKAKKLTSGLLCVIMSIMMAINASASPDYLVGDVDRNGSVEASDARRILRYSSKLSTYTKLQGLLADADLDGDVTAADARIVLRMSSNLTPQINYDGRFYSEYTPNKFNDTGSFPAVGSKTSHIQYRMNCYGYPFGNILDGPATITSDGDGYKQQPGEFAKTADKSNTVINIVKNNPSASMTRVVNNMTLDAARFGYTVTPYTPSGSTVAQYGTSSRLIAVVTGNTDYHFYMQHSDGTWSHKPGSYPVTNKSFDDNVVLTNANIKAKANQGIYVSNALKVFVITRDAVMDYPHGVRCCLNWPCNHTQSALYHKDKAGDHLITSTNMSIGSFSPISANIDFGEDRDVFYFTIPIAKFYTIKTDYTATGLIDLNCIIYNSIGEIFVTDSSVGPVNKTYLMNAGGYYIEIFEANKWSPVAYTLTIS